VRVGANESTQHGLCAYHRGPVTPPRSANLTCHGPVWGRFVRVQRTTPNYVDSLELCEVKIYIRESKYPE